MRISDLYKFIYGQQSGAALLGAIVVLGLVFTLVDQKKRKAPSAGGRSGGKILRHLKDPFVLGMLLAAGGATWLLWPIAPEWTWLFWVLPAMLLVLGAGTKEPVVCRLAGYSWSINDFCRGWLITGDTGSGKTFALRRVMHEVFKNTKRRPWGGLVIDEKGDEVRALVEIAEHYRRSNDVRLLETRPDEAPSYWTPKEKFNLLYDFRIPAPTYAKALVDTACMIGGKENDQAFFRNQAQINMGEGIELLRVMDRIPTISDLLEVLRYRDILTGCLLEIEAKSNQGDPTASRVLNHFQNSYLKQPEEQLGGVISTIETYLLYFTRPEVAEVFSTDENTFDFDIMEEGGIIGVSMPQKLAIERRYINCLLKLLYYQHVRQRFRIKDKGHLNLLVLWQDEVQRFISEADGDVDVMRSARGTSVMATQSKISLFPPLGGRDKANVTILNLRNRIIFTAADKDCAELSAEMIGKRDTWRRTVSSGGGQKRSVSRQEDEKYWVKASDFMTLQKFRAILRHASGRWKQCVVPPLDNQGQVPAWFQMGQY
jgi:Type IV secretion-system coupling protein DNA-binding domain